MFEFSGCKVTNLYPCIEIFVVSLCFLYVLKYVTPPLFKKFIYLYISVLSCILKLRILECYANL